ncbi:MAG: enoyl-CoA hydratase/isomerase family protein [bacterium]
MIELERIGAVFVLRMDEGENRFSITNVKRIHELLDEVEAAGNPSALVTVGSGKFYSNGFDMVEMMADEGKNAAPLIEGALRVLARILSFPAPTVAAVNGHAFGAGAQLAVAHDHRIMRADRGYWCMPEINMPAPLHPGMIALLQARVPATSVSRLIVTGTRYGGEDALAAGIVDEVAAESAVLTRAVDAAAALAGQADPVMRTLKESLYPVALRELALPAHMTPGVDPTRKIEPR